MLNRARATSFPMVPVMVALPDLGRQLVARLNVETGHLTNTNPNRATQFRFCPSCGRRMLAISKSEIYECKECRVFVTEPTETNSRR
jgi:tRNA(Ile2) C34 agmatinyltransferase TiaS